MNNNAVEGQRGGLIKPSARRSIHEHPNCLFPSHPSMGHYGIPDNRQKQTRASQSPVGQDVVDNVQSKFTNTSSPITTRRVIQKRNSSGNPDPASYTDDSDNKVHAHSLPANLSAISSEEYGQWLPPHNISLESATHTDESSFQSDSRDVNGSGCSSEDEVQQPANEPLSKKSRLTFLSFIVLIAALCYGYFNEISEIPQIFTASNNYKNNRFDLYNIRAKYKITDDSILQIQTGITTIYERHDTGSFVFAYNSDADNFDPIAFDNFIDSVAIMASRYLRNKSVQHLVVDGSKLEVGTHAELINKYRENVTKNGVMVVKKLEEIPSALAMAFHYYCDEYNPLVKKSAILFTLDMTKCSHNPVEQRPILTEMEKCLKKKWSGVPKDNIGALLSRVLNTVIDVTGDS